MSIELGIEGEGRQKASPGPESFALVPRAGRWTDFHEELPSVHEMVAASERFRAVALVQVCSDLLLVAPLMSVQKGIEATSSELAAHSQEARGAASATGSGAATDTVTVSVAELYPGAVGPERLLNKQVQTASCTAWSQRIADSVLSVLRNYWNERHCNVGHSSSSAMILRLSSTLALDNLRSVLF